MTLSIGIFLFLFSIFTIWNRYGQWLFFNKKETPFTTINKNQITVVIPFYNEELRMKTLIDSLLKTDITDLEFIFVDDSSTDNSCLLLEPLLLNDSIQLVKNNGQGKKRAIQTGILLSNRDYILTWDADISILSDYFDNIVRLPAKDLLLLPVRFQGSVLQNLLHIDIDLTQIINIAKAGYSSPIVCSGANLLFKRMKYWELENIENHQHIESGDDQFLLTAFKNGNASIQLIIDSKFAVYTPCENSILTFLHQRFRWISKTPMTKDKSAIKITQISFLLHVLFWLLSIYYLYTDIFSFYFLFTGKIILDLIITFPYYKSIKTMNRISLLFIYELILPFYVIILALTSSFSTPNWKGRSLKK